MIYDIIENLKQYSGYDKRFENIAEFISSHDMKTIAPGSYDVCEGVKVNISEYEPGTGGDYEFHKCFHDLQYAITGSEIIEVIPSSKGVNNIGYKYDIDFFTDKTCNATKVALDEGTFVFLTPDDAHKPCIKSNTDTIRKAVFKLEI